VQNIRGITGVGLSQGRHAGAVYRLKPELAAEYGITAQLDDARDDRR
jgi:hypothetical protein